MNRDYPYVDEHEFNCAYILENKEKPRMTCYETVKSSHPDWDEQTLYEYTQRNCPSYLKLLPDPDWCTYALFFNHCADCWNREMEDK